MGYPLERRKIYVARYPYQPPEVKFELAGWQLYLRPS